MPDCQICQRPTPQATLGDREVVCSDCLLTVIRDAAAAQRSETRDGLAARALPAPGSLVARWSDGAIRWCAGEEAQ